MFLYYIWYGWKLKNILVDTLINICIISKKKKKNIEKLDAIIII